MKILYLMTEPFGLGGVQSDILALSGYLAGRRHEVFVATRPGILLDELLAKGATFVQGDFHFHGLAGLYRGAVSIRRLVREHGIELVAPQSVRTSILCYLALRILPFSPRLAGSNSCPPIVTTVHNIHNPVHFRYAGHILNQCSDYVIFESHYERDRLLASGLSPERSRVVHSGIDTDRFQVRDPSPRLLEEFDIDKETQVVFAIVARLSEEKGHRYLLEAFARVCLAMPHARLLVVGDGPLLEQVMAQARGLGLEKNVLFTGPRRDIPEILSVIDVFVLASDRESFPLAAREAMAAGRPVIAPDIGGCPEVVAHGETGLLFPAADVAQLAFSMLDIVKEKKYIRYGMAARRRVEERFSTAQWFAGNEEIYSSYLRKAGVDREQEADDRP